MTHQRDFRSHNTSCLDPYTVIYRHGHADLLDIVDPKLNIRFLESLVSSRKHSVDLRLDSLCLIN